MGSRGGFGPGVESRLDHASPALAPVSSPAPPPSSEPVAASRRAVRRPSGFGSCSAASGSLVALPTYNYTQRARPHARPWPRSIRPIAPDTPSRFPEFLPPPQEFLGRWDRPHTRFVRPCPICRRSGASASTPVDRTSSIAIARCATTAAVTAPRGGQCQTWSAQVYPGTRKTLHRRSRLGASVESPSSVACTMGFLRPF